MTEPRPRPVRARRGRVVEAKLTLPQTGILRAAVKAFLEEEWDGPTVRAAHNALAELDRAELEARR